MILKKNDVKFAKHTYLFGNILVPMRNKFNAKTLNINIFFGLKQIISKNIPIIQLILYKTIT